MTRVKPSAAADAIIAAGRRLGSRGLISAGEGNLSVRLDEERILISPTGRRKDELGPDDLVVVRVDDGRAAESRSPSGLAPSSDLAIHRAVHHALPELGAVAHAHLPAALALTLAGEVPDPHVLPETALLLPLLPYLAFGAMGSAELAARIADALTTEPQPFATAVLLERHGAVAVGPDAATAVDRLELIEVLCRAWRDALLLRAARATLDAAGIVGAPTAPEVPRPPRATKEDG
jgi:L-fuculose-phosphate aldolase